MIRRYVVGLAALLMAGANGAAAQSNVQFNRPGSGARAAGMANAFIGISDDGTAASWNPAGLGQLRKPELSVVTNTSRRSSRSQGFRSRDDADRYRPFGSAFLASSLDFASVAVPLTIAGKPVTFQGAWRRLYALDFRENFETTREPLAVLRTPTSVYVNDDVVGSVDLVSVAAAVKVTRRVALGASANLWRGKWVEHVDISEDVPGGSSRFRNQTQNNRIDGKNLNLGLLLTYPRWSVGLVYLSPLRSDYDATATVVSNESLPAHDGLDAKLRFSRGLGLGAAWRPAPQWTLDADMTWDEWTDSAIEFPDGHLMSIFDGLPPDLSATRDTLSVNAGAERLFHGEGYVVPLRFGAAWEPQGGRSPYTRDPVNWVMLAAGTGYNTNSLKFDAALQYRWTNFRDGGHFSVDAPPPSDLPSVVGERSLREWRIKFSVILRITDTEKLHRTLGKIFGDS
jgi:hypothetical protein